VHAARRGLGWGLASYLRVKTRGRGKYSRVHAYSLASHTLARVTLAVIRTVYDGYRPLSVASATYSGLR